LLPVSLGETHGSDEEIRNNFSLWIGADMGEKGGANIEVAHHLNEGEEHEEKHATSRVHKIVEVVEAILLALVAITTAWSGYQSAKFDSVQSELYGRSSRLRVEGQALELEGNQAKTFDASTIVEWLKAEATGQTKLAALFERRLLPEIRPAFEAWKKTDPLNNPNAPPGPARMAEYHDVMGEQAAAKNQEATDLFEKGTRAREHADDYVRVTVFLATVLLLIAISQRFRSHRIRTVLAVVALLVLSIPVWRLLTLPRL
jgi:uncharacterized membrane protein